MGSEFIPGKPGTGGSLQKEVRPAGGPNSSAPQAGRSTPEAVIPAPSKIPWPTMPATAQKPAATFKCPKCSADARDVARFCPRCHATLRFECPSCRNTQRTGGKCEKCGIDFIKYIGAVVAAKKAEADAIHDRLESRSSLLKGILWLPFNGGVSLIRHFFRRDRD